MNRLIEADVNEIIAQYYYRPDGLRIIKWVAGVFTYHIWNGGNISAELDGNGAVTAKYIYGNQRIAGESNNVRKYYLYNAHGDVVQLTDDMGAVLWYYDYDAFGNEKNPDPNDTNAFRYCGEYFDTETGTIYLRARYYDPRIGRFTQQDPISDGLNWYTYANNSPVMFIDPSGLEVWGVGGGISAGFMFYFSIETYYVWDDYGNTGEIWVFGAGGGFGASLNATYINYKNVDNIWQLGDGLGAAIGIGVLYFSGEYLHSEDGSGYSGSLSYGLPFDFHATITKTWFRYSFESDLWKSLQKYPKYLWEDLQDYPTESWDELQHYDTSLWQYYGTPEWYYIEIFQRNS